MKADKGFTLIEVLVVVVMVGVLAAIAAPSWVALADGRRLSVAAEKAYLAMREAQSNAKRDKVDWQVTFRQDYQGVFQVAVHPASNPTPSAGYWKSFDPNIQIVAYNTTLPFDTSTSFWSIKFDFKGNPDSEQMKRLSDENKVPNIVLATKDNEHKQRCAAIRTLLGAIAQGQDEAECNRLNSSSS